MKSVNCRKSAFSRQCFKLEVLRSSSKASTTKAMSSTESVSIPTANCRKSAFSRQCLKHRLPLNTHRSWLDARTAPLVCLHEVTCATHVAGSYLRLRNVCITQLQACAYTRSRVSAQGHVRACRPPPQTAVKTLFHIVETPICEECRVWGVGIFAHSRIAETQIHFQRQRRCPPRRACWCPPQTADKKRMHLY